MPVGERPFPVFVGHGLRLGTSQRSVTAVRCCSLASPGQLVDDVARRPRFLPLRGPDPRAELLVGHLLVLPVDLGVPQGPPRGPAGGELLDLSWLRSGPEHPVRVVVVAQLAVAAIVPALYRQPCCSIASTGNSSRASTVHAGGSARASSPSFSAF
ncbi:hypothetical protein [Pseudonocardia parietis]|uniref:Uncharacterized protein n=1 Tax=Pseudonocardia parietis TaxID=570936 RepID=A0ABS4W0E0_9PSEU|nr:hypothetical protein [Pseudonocardia parietis]MBP2369634.1 hypothetical protein [Pseudonocardia parietis]